MLPVVVGLVDTTGTIDPDVISAAASALNVQVTQHLPQYWTTAQPAVVRAFTNASAIPQGVWPVLIVAALPPNEGGFHFTAHNQPYAKVAATPGSNNWTIDASHETLEMLVDPSGNKLQVAKSIILAAGQVGDGELDYEYLVEVCDPCEANEFAYAISGMLVSDFITPSFYDTQPVTGTVYSYNGSIKVPRRILPGGYITWTDPESFDIKQLIWLDPTGQPELRTVGNAQNQGASLRGFVDAQTRHVFHEIRAQSSNDRLAARSLKAWEVSDHISRRRASRYV